MECGKVHLFQHTWYITQFYNNHYTQAIIKEAFNITSCKMLSNNTFMGTCVDINKHLAN